MDFDFLKGVLINLVIIYSIISCLLVISIILYLLIPYLITTLADIIREIIIIVRDIVERFMELK